MAEDDLLQNFVLFIILYLSKSAILLSLHALDKVKRLKKIYLVVVIAEPNRIIVFCLTILRQT